MWHADEEQCVVDPSIMIIKKFYFVNMVVGMKNENSDLDDISSNTISQQWKWLQDHWR